MAQTIDFFDLFGNVAGTMTSADSSNTWLIADIGATSTRCGIYAQHSNAIARVQIYQNDSFVSLQALLTEYLEKLVIRPAKCVLAVAAPVDSDQVQMINREWRFSGAELGQQFAFDTVELMNDFHAVAYGLPTYGDQDRVEIGRATSYRIGNYAVLGPGSGLGMSAWIGGRSSGTAMRGEGGHTTMPARDADEERIIDKIRDRFGHCSAERILSGPGLVALHSAMHEEILASPEEITGNTDNPDCWATLNQFFRFLGSAAADLALVTGAAGLYVAGGIVPANLESIRKSDFRSRFEDKNRYVDYMRAIPTWVITAAEPGLLGLATYLDLQSAKVAASKNCPATNTPNITISRS